MANYTILLIDYEPRSIERFRDPLTGAGYTVEIATDGVAGIEAFHRLNPDMVLVEAMIPKKHGFEVCQELKRTPHGRRTPVLITTGVYKGRKYRTQALHIYGCDEYIEKPIAPEQLLALVGRFLGSNAAGSTGKSTEPAAEPASTDGDGVGSHTATSKAQTASSPQPPKPAVQRAKTTSMPQAVVSDGTTEDEIMARLDAIMPGGAGVAPHATDAAPIAVAAVVQTVEEAPVSAEPAFEQDPIAQIREELDAELGSFSAALALAPSPVLESMGEPIPSDQNVTPSVLEFLPAPEVETPIAPQANPAPSEADARSGQVVSFDTKRPRKSRKSERFDKGPKQKAAPATPGVEPLAASAVEPLAAARQVTLPRGSVVASELGIAAERRGIPVWVWAVMGLVGIAAVYIAFSRTASNRLDAAQLPVTSGKAVESVPVNVAEPTSTVPPTKSPSTFTPLPQASESAPALLEPPKVVLNGTKTAPPKKTPERNPAPSPSQSATASLNDATISSRESSTPRKEGTAVPVPHAVKPKTPATVIKEPSQAVPKALSAPEGLGDAVSGVESVPDSAVTAPSTTIAVGALVPIDEADAMPASVSRKPPNYSLQAREMKLAGTVVMNVLINEHGTVDQVVLVIGIPGADVNESALRAARGWTYRPATKNGVPVKVWKSEQVVFKP